jgi:hypothetical protein
MSKPFYTALLAASVIFSTTLLVVAQQSGAVKGPGAGPAPALALASNPLDKNPSAIQAERNSSAAPARSVTVRRARATRAQPRR